MGIREAIRPSRPYDRTQAAMEDISPEERAEVNDVLLNDPSFSLEDVATYLNRMTDNRHQVNRKSVSGYKQKLANGRANA